jgi:hypothetical protein
VALVLTPLGVLLGALAARAAQEAIDQHIATGDLDGLGADGDRLTWRWSAWASPPAPSPSTRSTSVGLRALTRAARRVFTHVMDQGQRFFDTRTTGALMTRTTNDVEAVYESLAWGAVSLLSDALTASSAPRRDAAPRLAAHPRQPLARARSSC